MEESDDFFFLSAILLGWLNSFPSVQNYFFFLPLHKDLSPAETGQNIMNLMQDYIVQDFQKVAYFILKKKKKGSSELRTHYQTYRR